MTAHQQALPLQPDQLAENLVDAQATLFLLQSSVRARLGIAEEGLPSFQRVEAQIGFTALALSATNGKSFGAGDEPRKDVLGLPNAGRRGELCEKDLVGDVLRFGRFGSWPAQHAQQVVAVRLVDPRYVENGWTIRELRSQSTRS